MERKKYDVEICYIHIFVVEILKVSVIFLNVFQLETKSANFPTGKVLMFGKISMIIQFIIITT